MWIICDAGFFNVICQDSDAVKGLLTIKARSRKDLEDLKHFITNSKPIEESMVTDYRFRMKAPSPYVRAGFDEIISKIDYPKTKPKLMERNPDRSKIYLNVWGDLLGIQEPNA